MKRRKFLGAGTLAAGAGLVLSPAEVRAESAKTSKAAAKKTLWLFLSDITHPDIHLVIPSLAWIAGEAGVEFECYLEAERNGRLFARTGSTVIGGFQHQQFNYLNAVFDVRYIILGEAPLFKSSIALFGHSVLVESDDTVAIYRAALKQANIRKVSEAVFGFAGTKKVKDKTLELGPYLYPEIYFRKALAFPASAVKTAAALLKEVGAGQVGTLFLEGDEKKNVTGQFAGAREIDTLKGDESYDAISLRIAERWKKSAKGIVFGDPAAILSQLPKLCREARIPLYGEKNKLAPAQVVVTAYTEQKSSVADDVIRLAGEIGNKVIVGRQTGDGDLFHWSKGGVCIQIMDPNRPPFPIVETLPHTWTRTGKTLFDEEPDDATLEKYAGEGKVLGTLLWHSGEMAHNEAMINLFEVVQFSGIKMGMGVHAARYETAPQLWELINIPRSKGGVKGYIEPVLHSGGMGVLAEINCPPDELKKHCTEALGRIRKLAGAEATPRGYYAFMDSDYKTLSEVKPKTYQAISANGLEYVVSSVTPGRNRIVHKENNCVVINQSARSICGASPFVRVTTVEDLKESSPVRPGWMIGTLDAPVISFNDYIWRHGPRFMELVDYMTKNNNVINVLPHTIARYARILEQKGFLPKVG